MLVHTGYGGQRISPGDTVEVNPYLGKFWIANGIAEEPKKKKVIENGRETIERNAKGQKNKNKQKEVKTDGVDSGNGLICDTSGSDSLCGGELCDNIGESDSVDGSDE
jgi:hypothetical protein